MMTRRTISLLRVWIGLGAFLSVGMVQAEDVPVPTVAPEYAFGFNRSTRVAGELHRSLGSSIAQKRQGIGAGIAVFFPLSDSNFDLGIRYVYIHEARNPEPPSTASAFTLLTFVFDYFIWPTKVGGLFVGGEIGVTDPAASEFFSVYSDYAFVAKFGYEYTIPNSRWSATFEARRSVRDDSPLKATRESQLYSNGLALGARYRL
jgi:hypothetical protein